MHKKHFIFSRQNGKTQLSKYYKEKFMAYLDGCGDGLKEGIKLQNQAVLEEVIRFSTHEGASADCTKLYSNISKLMGVEDE